MGMKAKARCAYCGDVAYGYYTIHRDGFCDGPEVRPCIECGRDQHPSCEAIWSRISRKQVPA